MKIVILDGHDINPGDLNWDALRDLGSLEVFDRTAENLIVPRARESVVTNLRAFLEDRPVNVVN